MPIYEYGCEACGGTFEAWQKITDAPVRKCELCGSRKVSKMISNTSFQLKGTGWYATDYARKGSGGSSPSKPKKADATKSSSSD